MFNKPTLKPKTPSLPVVPDLVTKYFDEKASTTRESVIIKKFLDFINKKKVFLDFVDTPENIDVIHDFLLENRSTKRFMKDADFEEIIGELRESGLITKPIVKKPIEKPKITEQVDNRIELGLKKGETELEGNDIEKNIISSERGEKNLIENEKKVDEIFESCEQRETSNIEYFLKFVEAGIVSKETAYLDYNELRVRIDKWNENKSNLTETERRRQEKAKKIATIVESGIEYAIKKLGWFGKGVSMKRAADYNDYKRSIDNVIEIKKGDGERDFIGLATDVTFNRINEDPFRDKFLKLLSFIERGKKPALKYETDSDGNLLEEFAVPKVLLHFNYGDVKLFLNIMDASLSSEEGELREKYKNVPQRAKYLQQIIFQCRILSTFAEQHKNDISEQYEAVIESINKLAENDIELRTVLENTEETEFELKLSEILENYNNGKRYK